jgi:sugar phosphate isomerase/epimerase
MSRSQTAPIIKLFCSTGTFSRHPDFTDYRAILEYGRGLSVDGLEVMFYESWYGSLEQVVADLVDSGLSYPVVHAEKSISNGLGRDDPAQLDLAYQRLEMNCRLAQEIGAESLVLHLWGWPESDKSFERNLDALPVCVDLAQRHNLDLAVETIPCVVSDPLTRVQQAVERDPRCRIALDTEFLALHGQEEAVFEADWLWCDARVVHVHIKDFDGQMHDAQGQRRYLQPGEGRIDFKQFFAALRAREYNGAVSLESPAIAHDGSVDIDTLGRSLAFIRDLMAEES